MVVFKISELFTEKSLGAFFEDMVKKQPDHEFLVYPDRGLRFTYKEFDERADNLAKGLLGIGVGKGDHVGIWAKNVPEWITFMFATAKIGAVLVTMNTAYQKHEVDYVLEQSDMKAIAMTDGFRDTSYFNIMYELVPELKTQARGNLHSKKYPHLKDIIYIGQRKHRGMYNTNELLLLGQNVADKELTDAKANVDQNDVIMMQYTSGTEGFPKGVMLTSRNIVNDGFYIGENMNYTNKDRLCLIVPLFHCFGTVLGVMSVITHGSTLVMLEEFNPLLTLSSIQKEKCTSVYGVPTMFIAELNHPMFDMFDLTSLRTGIMAGSTCPKEAMKAVIDKMNMKEITSVYGLTEAAPGFTQTCAEDTFEKKVNTVGRKFPNIEVKIVDPETGEELPQGEKGEIMCKGFNVMKGYYNMPEKTAETIEPDGWLHSGDLAVEDEDGYYSIVGRIKDMIIRGGENIYPREIEEYLFTHPCIQDAQVAGIPDEKYGEIVGAFIIKEDNCDDLTEADIRDFCIGNIARFKVPKYVFFVEEFPLTTSGKIQKYKLGDLGLKLLEERKVNGDL
ncbi:MAG: AMP-binding protein [Methanobacteriaceae archaeon]|mgnify:CR=1 FL=1|jgi:fatty-acyl-CoA synthase|uniref:AMP-binding protein n=2 Tax=Methanobacteriaceae TaxID=2159 RepID=UPI002A0B16DB|nr:AMP-binding protein [Methanobacteriaceae archaeon]MDD3409087.1 AMP-binding protein [Methanobacteriaceae archaeon]MDD4594217.1 AMP-binding protein [Methanobacteriaceae archaeon]